MGFIYENAVFKKNCGAAGYTDYEIINAAVREKLSYDAEGKDNGGAVVYFITGLSKCLSPQGRETELPRIGPYDMMILHRGSDAERKLLVTEASYFTGGPLEHIRLTLR